MPRQASLNPNVAKAEGAADARRPIRRAQGEAVVVYADPLTTQQMLYHRLSRRVNNLAIFSIPWISFVVNSSKLLKKAAKKDYHCFSEPFAMLFMQL